MDGSNYSLQYYQGEHEDDYSLKKDGRICIFHNGILKMTYEVDEEDSGIGDFTCFENGRVAFVQPFDDILDKHNFNRIVNHCRGERMEIYSYESGKLIYHGEFNEKREREGWGIQYDGRLDRMLLEGIWKGNKLVEIIRKIEGNIMTEFKRNGNNTIASNRIPLYVGEFVYDEEKESFIRNGRGYWIDEETRIATREVEWKNGVEVSGRDLYDGWYTRSTAPKPTPVSKLVSTPIPKTQPKPESTVKSTPTPIETIKPAANDCVKPAPKPMPIAIPAPEPKSVPVPPKPEEPAPTPIKVTGSTKWTDVSLQVTDLTISSKCCNDLNALDLNRFEWLQSIEIGNDCFGSVKTFKIDGLNRLKTIKIGNNSFTQKKNSYGNDESKSFHILNCESLESIQIGEYSFSDFGGEFELKNLPQLQSIQIGLMGSVSWNFFFSSFVVRGIELILNIVMNRSSKSTIHYIR